MREQAKYFAERIVSYDLWSTTPMWRIIALMHEAIQHFLETGEVANSDAAVPPDLSEEDLAWARDNEVVSLWDQLSNLPRMYEDLCREWLLPTGLGLLTSYSSPSD